MSTPAPVASLDALDALEGVESLCLLIAEDDRPLSGLPGFVDWRLCGALSRQLLDHFFEGRAGENLLLPGAPRVVPGRIFALGVGPAKLAKADVVLSAAVDVLSKAKVSSVAVGYSDGMALTRAQVEGALAKAVGGRVVVLPSKND